MNTLRTTFLLLLTASHLAKGAPPSRDLEFKDGKLIYNADERGNRVPDYSYAGYAAGERPIPTVQARIFVESLPPNGDDRTAEIQAAIDQVSDLPLDRNGFRGAVLLPAGDYQLKGSLVIRASGVVLRGSGTQERFGTRLIVVGRDRGTAIRIEGNPALAVGDPQPITDAYVPVNASKLSVRDASRFAVGDAVAITHPSSKEWIIALGMDDLGGDRHGPSWRPGSRDITWTRIITRIDGKTLSLDAPLTYALDASTGPSTLTKLDPSGIVTNVGVENLVISGAGVTEDEDRVWFGIGINHARDVWVRRVTCQYMIGSAVAAWESVSRATVEDCKNLYPNGAIGGLRRNSFFTSGQQVLMQRLYTDRGNHDFAVGLAAPGPNAFVQCESVGSHGESGAIESAACGTLFDRVRIDGQPLSLRNRTYEGQGVGWASLNGTIWNSSASLIVNQRPPTAQNWAMGASGEFDGDGAWAGSEDDVEPDSLFYTQLAERIGPEARDRALLNVPTVQGSRAPTLESAADATAASRKARVTMSEWIDLLCQQKPLPVSTDGLSPLRMKLVPRPSMVVANGSRPIAISDGWITMDGRIAIGKQMGVPWWGGGLRPDDIAKAKPALTRFVPGRTGSGLTDNLREVVEGMLVRGDVAAWQHPPLWYDRRRDDHSRVRRKDGEVVGPFYETPWARHGRNSGSAWDGLSRYDVAGTNRWYFERLRQFADLGEERGLILFNGLYNQHSVLEAGAHYADFPWRPANNVNRVGIPEPIFYASDKLVYVAEPFYDVTNDDRAQLHRSYMRNVLNELADKPNVIHFLSEEYTGPLAFTQFWLDVVAEWKRDTGKDVRIALYATKDVTDAILADEKRAPIVSLIYNCYNNPNEAGWWYQPDGTLYAPQGGKSLSPRQWGRLLRPKSAGFEQVYRAVRECRLKYPDKPFVYDGPEELGWAVLLGGGSLAPLPKTTDIDLLKAIKAMQPMPDRVGLRDEAGNELIYSDQKRSEGNVRGVDMKTGQITPRDTKLYWITAK